MSWRLGGRVGEGRDEGTAVRGGRRHMGPDPVGRVLRVGGTRPTDMLTDSLNLRQPEHGPAGGAAEMG